MKVVIVGKTRLLNHACIGAISKDASLRLQKPGGYPFENGDLDLGQIVVIEGYASPEPILPHSEDFVVERRQLVGTLKPDEVRDLVLKRSRVVEGHYTELLNRCLVRKHTGKLIVTRDNVPDHSTEFWRAPGDFNLRLEGEKKAPTFVCDDDPAIKLKYVGMEQPIDVIPSGSLLRISLARWWAGINKDEPEACYAQLSGWWLM